MENINEQFKRLFCELDLTDDQAAMIKKLQKDVDAALRQPLVIESVCSCSKGKGIDHDEDGKAYCIDCGNYLEQTVP